MCIYSFAYVLRPKFKMVLLGDWIFEKLLGRVIGDDMAVIVGRSLVTIVPLTSVILTFMDHYGPNTP